MSFRSRRTFTRFALAATIGTALATGCAGTFAQAADDDDELLDVKIFRNVMTGLGLRRDEGSGIEYRERSPLVLPPSSQITVLPTPATDSAAKKAANWPDDPDVKRVKQRKEAERKRKPVEVGVDDKPLPQDKLTEGPPPPPKGSRAGEAPGRSAESSAAPSTNAELGSKGLMHMLRTGFWAPKEEYKPFTGEPPRASLTEPPRGYRTPSPTQPYGVGKERWTPPAIDKNEPVR